MTVVHEVELVRRIFRLEEVSSFSQLKEGDLFVMYEPDDGEPVNDGKVNRMKKFKDENEVDVDVVALKADEFGNPVTELVKPPKYEVVLTIPNE